MSGQPAITDNKLGSTNSLVATRGRGKTGRHLRLILGVLATAGAAYLAYGLIPEFGQPAYAMPIGVLVVGGLCVVFTGAGGWLAWKSDRWFPWVGPWATLIFLVGILSFGLGGLPLIFLGLAFWLYFRIHRKNGLAPGQQLNSPVSPDGYWWLNGMVWERTKEIKRDQAEEATRRQRLRLAKAATGLLSFGLVTLVALYWLGGPLITCQVGGSSGGTPIWLWWGSSGGESSGTISGDGSDATTSVMSGVIQAGGNTYTYTCKGDQLTLFEMLGK